MTEWGWEFAAHEKMGVIKNRLLSLLLKGIPQFEAVDILVNDFYEDEWSLYCLSHLLVSETGGIHQELRELVRERLAATINEVSDEFDEDDEDDYDPIVFIELLEKVEGAEETKEP